MKLNKEIIRGVVEEELAEVKLRKRVREKVRNVVEQREEKKLKKKVLAGIFNDIAERSNEVPSDGYTEFSAWLTRLKEKVRQKMIDEDIL